MDKVSETRQALGKAVAELVTLAEKGGPDYEAKEKEVTELRLSVERLEKATALAAGTAQPAAQQATVDFASVRAHPGFRRQCAPSKLKAFKGDFAHERAFRVGQWMLATLYGNGDAAQWCRENGIIVQRAAEEGVNSLGGFLVPDDAMGPMIDLREKYGMFRKYARVVPMGRDKKPFPRRTGGLTMYFPGEGGSVTESSAGWDNVMLSAKKGAVLTRLSTEVEEDSIIDVADWLVNEIAYAFAQAEDNIGFNGDGTSTYGGMRGILQLLIDGSHGGGVITATSGHDTFAEVDATDITNLMGALPQYALGDAGFYCSQFAFATVFERLIATAGGNSVATLSGEVIYRYLGFPIRISQKMTTGTASWNAKIGLLFGDMSMSSTLGDRRQVTILQSGHRYMDTDQIGILGTERFDIVNHDLGDATNAGPLVGLKGN